MPDSSIVASDLETIASVFGGTRDANNMTGVFPEVIQNLEGQSMLTSCHAPLAKVDLSGWERAPTRP
jgi:hypothetical protein